MKVISAIKYERNAGTKAPKDIDDILKEKYNAKIISIRKNKKTYKLKILFSIIYARLTKDVCVVQYPLVKKVSVYNLFLKEKTIIFVHDMFGLRDQKEERIKQEIEIFKKFKYLIVHNNAMKEFLMQKGIEEENIFVLELFDYIINDEVRNEQNKKEEKLKIVYAGNLAKNKSTFLCQMDEEKIDFEMYLYGNGLESDIPSKVKYKGIYNFKELYNVEGDVGLIWDGAIDESDEENTYKHYNKFNNPHKLSCYIAMGIPVIVWRKAAIAELVKKYDIGYVISNVYDINNINFSDYEIKKRNVEELRKKVINGYFTKRVIDEVMKKMI